MNWQTTTDGCSDAEESAGVREAGVFGRGESGSDRLSIIGPPVGERWQERKSYRRVRPLAALVLAGAVGLAGYGLLTSRRENRASTSARVPPAANSAAATNLPPPNLLRPLSPEEAANENANRPFVTRPDTAASRFVLRTDAPDRERALTCLAQAVYYEAAGEGADGQRAVAQVVINRLHHPGFPSTVCGVVYQGGDRATGCQFSFVCDGSMQRIPVPSLWARARQIAAQAMSGKVFAPVGHATHYHADYVLPYWADSLDKSVQLGHHIFYRLRNIFGEAQAFSQRYGGVEPQVRVPGAAVVIPASAVTPQLANALTSDILNGKLPEAEKAGQPAAPPLAADLGRGSLIIDGQSSAQLARPEQKPPADCETSAEGKQLSPVAKTDLRAGKASSCSSS